MKLIYTFIIGLSFLLISCSSEESVSNEDRFFPNDYLNLSCKNEQGMNAKVLLSLQEKWARLEFDSQVHYADLDITPSSFLIYEKAKRDGNIIEIIQSTLEIKTLGRTSQVQVFCEKIELPYVIQGPNS